MTAIDKPHMDLASKWYALKVINGQEKTIKKNFEAELERQSLRDYVTQVLVPSQQVYQIRDGKKQVKERSFFPGYILVCADLSNKRVMHVLRDIPNVLGFLGSRSWGNNQPPVPLRQKEVEKILARLDESGGATVSLEDLFVVGETVKIIDGPFGGFSGSIQEIFDERKKLNVTVKIFDRDTPIELSYTQVEKAL